MVIWPTDLGRFVGLSSLPTQALATAPIKASHGTPLRDPEHARDGLTDAESSLIRVYGAEVEMGQPGRGEGDDQGGVEVAGDWRRQRQLTAAALAPLC